VIICTCMLITMYLPTHVFLFLFSEYPLLHKHLNER
jgi:hypothetical protein